MSRKDWIIVFKDLPNDRFLGHPNGYQTMSRVNAHGWHYKKDALEVAARYKYSVICIERRD